MLNISGIISKFIKNSSQRDIDKLKTIVEKINTWEAKIKEIPTESFPEKTLEFKSKIQKGTKLEDLIPEAFACVREAARRTLGERHYDGYTWTDRFTVLISANGFNVDSTKIDLIGGKSDYPNSCIFSVNTHEFLLAM